MAMITNIQHFLDDNGDIAELRPEALYLLYFLGNIIITATIEYDKPISIADIPCRTINNDESCPGEIEVWVYAENNEIGWECTECGEEGIISNWEQTLWDQRNYTRHYFTGFT
jgi:hypothetical protein